MIHGEDTEETLKLLRVELLIGEVTVGQRQWRQWLCPCLCGRIWRCWKICLSDFYCLFLIQICFQV